MLFPVFTLWRKEALAPQLVLLIAGLASHRIAPHGWQVLDTLLLLLC